MIRIKRDFELTGFELRKFHGSIVGLGKDIT